MKEEKVFNIREATAKSIRQFIDEKRGLVTKMDLVKKSGYGYGYLNITFKKYIGVTLMRYCKNERMKFAKEILEQSDLKKTLLDIAYSLNTDPSNLSRDFKRAFGITPDKYRRSLK